jgi:hypothetical protein
VKWTLDGAVLHLHDLPGSRKPFEVGLAAAGQAARAAGAILYAEVFEDDPAAALLEQSGFSLDWTEPDVRDGQVVRRLSFVSTVEQLQGKLP